MNVLPWPLFTVSNGFLNFQIRFPSSPISLSCIKKNFFFQKKKQQQQNVQEEVYITCTHVFMCIRNYEGTAYWSVNCKMNTSCVGLQILICGLFRVISHLKQERNSKILIQKIYFLY